MSHVMNGEVPNGESRVVELMRAGSGGCVVSLPNADWLRAISKAYREDGVYESGMKFRIALVPESDGFGNMPGCSIKIVPGDHAAKLYGAMGTIRLRGIPETGSLLRWNMDGMFSLSTNFDDLKALHTALGEVIASIEKKHKGES